MSEDKQGASKKVRLLSTADIYDVYGCQELLRGSVAGMAELHPLAEDDAAEVRARVYEIHGLYVDSAKARIRSEAFVGKELGDELSFESMFHLMRDLLAKNLTQKAMASGLGTEGLDLARIGMSAQPKVEKPPRPDVDPNWFRKGANSRMWDNPRWAEISEAYLALERSKNAQEMITTIDRLNQLQHNSFHILIDLQTGRMLENRSEGDLYGKYEQVRLNLQEVLDICHGKRSAVEFADKMSPLIGKLVRKYAA